MGGHYWSPVVAAHIDFSGQHRREPGIDLKTLKRWLRVPEFIAEYRRARWEAVEQAYARVQQNSNAAAAVLLKLMADPATPASARIRAALGVFGLAHEGLEEAPIIEPILSDSSYEVGAALLR